MQLKKKPKLWRNKKLMYFIKETLDANGRDAGSKAVADVNVILERNGANSINVI